jgi:peptidoglycan hydrolase-like protein with peptidoglycan-binding domain
MAAKQTGKAVPKSLSWIFKSMKGIVGKLEGALKGVLDFLKKLFPKSGVVGKIAGGFSSVMKKLGQELGQLTGVKATAQMAKQAPRVLAKKVAMGGLTGVALAEFFKEHRLKLGDSGKPVQKVQEWLNYTATQPEGKKFGIQPIKVDGKYGPDTVKQVSNFKKYVKSTGQYDINDTDGTFIQPEIAQALGIELQPSGFNKTVDFIFGKGALDKFGQKMASADQWAKKTFGTPNQSNTKQPVMA